jgi:DNA-directed RNA polymerase beta subunit
LTQYGSHDLPETERSSGDAQSDRGSEDSYQWFLMEGLKEAFDDISPIEDYGGKLSLEFVDFTAL